MRAAGQFIEEGEREGVLYGTSLQGNFLPKVRPSKTRLSNSDRSTKPRLVYLKRTPDESSFGCDVREAPEGPVIVSVVRNSAADRAHLCPAMVVHRVGGVSMKNITLGQFSRAVYDAEKKTPETGVPLVVAYSPKYRTLVKEAAGNNAADADTEGQGLAGSTILSLAFPYAGQLAAVTKQGPLRIQLWSAPRCSSTALMYSFAQRVDTTVVDEPMYAAWLAKYPEAFRLDREATLASGMATSYAEVVKNVVLGPCPTPVYFLKHMSKHFLDLSPKDAEAVLHAGPHVVLTRSPANVATSFEAGGAKPTLDELGFPALVSIVAQARAANQPVIVVDADILQQQPAAVLRELCKQLNLAYDEAMLKWEAGPKRYDGAWAPWWYKDLHQTTGFKHALSPQRPVPQALLPLVEECYPFYLYLQQHAVGGRSGAGLPNVDELVTPTLADPRNEHILVWVNGRLVPRSYASLSVFDSAVQGGDAVWEGLRVYNGKVWHLDEHLQRLQRSAKAMAFANVPSSEAIKDAIFRTLVANDMRDGVHMRLTLTRGKKTTSSMNPKFNQYGCSLIVLAEWKPIEGPATYDNANGIRLVTAANRRNPPQCVDSKIHHNNLINNILPKIQANEAGAADAVMLDLEGFVSETNATNLFCVRE
jgi:hypothetical protein